MKRLANKLACIEETGILEVDLRWLNNNYQRFLASYVRGCNAYWLRQIEPAHRYAALVCYLEQTYADTIDFIIEIHAKLMKRVEKQAKEPCTAAVHFPPRKSTGCGRSMPRRNQNEFKATSQ